MVRWVAGRGQTSSWGSSSSRRRSPFAFAVATEYLVADETTVRWRSLFRPRWTTWDHIESIEIGKMSLFPTHGDDVINLRFHTGAVRRVRASVGCGAQARRDWVAQTALLFMASGIPPEDRLDPDVAELVERVLGGRRVGRFARGTGGPRVPRVRASDDLLRGGAPCRPSRTR